jgi:SNF2 family DNA or RNA helicase
MLLLDYRASDRNATLTWDPVDESAVWLEPLRRLIFDCSDDARQENSYTLALPWWNFVSIRTQFGTVISGYGLSIGQEVIVSDAAQALLRTSRRYLDGYRDATAATRIPQAQLAETLRQAGFVRQLSAEQLRNVSLLAALPAAATFSVPGAGKTTEALASFAYRARHSERLLVIAPKNAFAAWDEQLKSCFANQSDYFVRLRHGRDIIASLLSCDPRFMLITYQQLVRVTDLIAAHCSRYPTFVYLDESHRIKSGVTMQTARAALDLSYVAAGKLVLSGTPMPQSVADLVPQVQFLYPELATNENNVADIIRPVYVRTTKAELGLQEVKRELVSLDMAPLQSRVYGLLKHEAARALANLNVRSSVGLRSIARSVVRLLQFTSNPALLSSQFGTVSAQLASAVLAEGDGPKLRYVFHRTRELVRQGHKVLIWSAYRANVEYIAESLADLGAFYIHGGVDAGDEDDDETREGKIKRFHDEEDVMVMVANPAAAGEGISLHTVCHHAIYLDRTFNAAHYLQSEDRIHRFGLDPNQDTFVEIVECRGTVDETVRARVGAKVTAMRTVLDDPSLNTEVVPVDVALGDDVEAFNAGLDAEDVRAVIESLGVSPP